MKTVFGKQGTFSWRDSVSLCVHHPKHAPFFVSQAVELLHPGSTRRTHASRPRAAVHAGIRSAPGARRDPAPPRPVHRPAHGEAAGRLHRRAPARPEPRDRHVVLGLAVGGGRPAPLQPAQRRRLGRFPLARHERVPRPLVHRQHRAREGVARRQEEQEGPEGPERPRRDRRRVRSPCSATRRFGPRPTASCWRSRAARCSGATGWKAESYPPLVANAVRQLLAVSPDLQTC